MILTVNGEQHEAAGGATVSSLLEALGLQADATVVEHNGVIVERAAYGSTSLADGDTLELVRFVGGG